MLVVGNDCLLRDERRTPGLIEWVDYGRAIFRWRILDFEDEGSFWLLPAERIVDFLFEDYAKTIGPTDLKILEEAITRLTQPLVVKAEKNAHEETERLIEKASLEAHSWLVTHSAYIAEGNRPDLNKRKGPEGLSADLLAYCDCLGIRALEEETAKALVLNPASGEWVKGMELVLAEMGLAKFESTQFRTEGVFEGYANKDNRKRYIILRLAFVRALLKLLDLSEVPLYRGMATERPWSYKERNFLSFTFSLEVAQDFSNFESNSSIRHSYLVKTTLPCTALFMTYLETEAMNLQYAEAEALVLTGATGSNLERWW